MRDRAERRAAPKPARHPPGGSDGGPASRGAPSSTLRFAEKRELILDGAAQLFNRRGIKAGTLSEVAASVGLATNSLTYYYRKKEDLVVACLMRSIGALDGVIAEVDTRLPPGDLAGRVRALVQGYAALLAAIEDRLRPALIFFGDMRALPQPQAEPAFAAYVAMFRRLRGLLHAGEAGAGVALPPARSAARQALNARSHGLLSQLLWARAWLGRYETGDYPRVAAAMADLLLHGLAAAGQGWPAQPLPAPDPAPTDSAGAETDSATRDAYLRTATRLVNDHGVGGASVERIAATLALTKGSFYHHHDTKHDLIDDCFERSFALVRRVQWAALAQAGPGRANGWQTLLAATLPLLALQTSPQGPLLRLTAWTELPGALRWQKFGTMNRLGERYAAMVVAGQADGSIRLVDPAVAAQLISGLINALAEVEHWLPGDGPPDLQPLLARPLLMGLLAQPLETA
jgi:AcrR family transcriptional regulator